jgi:hypothetical protein
MSTCAVWTSEGCGRLVRALAVASVAAAVCLAPAWLGAEDKDLAAAAAGAQVIKYTSQLDAEHGAHKIIEEHAAGSGWLSRDGSLPQEIIVRLPAVSRFNTLVLSAAGETTAEWARDVAVYAAEPFPTMGGWKLVAEVRLEARPGDQTFTVPESDGRFVRLLITSTQSPGAARVALDRVKLLRR